MFVNRGVREPRPNCIWKTLHTAGLSDTIKSTWYAAIHIIPTHEPLAAINLLPTMTCTSCGEPDTLQHGVTNCKEGPVMWNWTGARLAAIRLVYPKQINEDWTLRPTYQLCLHKSRRRSRGSAACRGGLGGSNPPPPKFQSFRGIYFRTNLIRIRVSFICKLSGSPD
jgi:hypothetical protein